MSYLVDTNVLSELARLEPDVGVTEWAGSQRSLTVSALTVEEIAFGLAWKPNARIRQWFDDFVETFCRVLPVTHEVALCAGELRGRLQPEGRPRTQADMLIAATALLHGSVVVTRNARDFEGCGVVVLNPFRGRG